MSSITHLWPSNNEFLLTMANPPGNGKLTHCRSQSILSRHGFQSEQSPGRAHDGGHNTDQETLQCVGHAHTPKNKNTKKLKNLNILNCFQLCVPFVWSLMRHRLSTW
eukprot:jgi/Ulvmu1/111/UM001_0115.1